jgi:hypothetical protein
MWPTVGRQVTAGAGLASHPRNLHTWDNPVSVRNGSDCGGRWRSGAVDACSRGKRRGLDELSCSGHQLSLRSLLAQQDAQVVGGGGVASVGGGAVPGQGLVVLAAPRQ